MSEKDPISARYFGNRGVMLAPVGHDPGAVPKGWGKWAVILDGRIVGTIAADPQGFGWWAKLKGSDEPATFVRGRERARDWIVERSGGER